LSRASNYVKIFGLIVTDEAINEKDKEVSSIKQRRLSHKEFKRKIQEVIVSGKVYQLKASRKYINNSDTKME
jgi:hypothetical protein